MTDRCERIAAAFAVLSPETREAVAEALEAARSPFLTAVGTAITDGGTLGRLRIDRALRRAETDGSFELIERLSEEPPWGVVRECLIEAQLEQKLT